LYLIQYWSCVWLTLLLICRCYKTQWDGPHEVYISNIWWVMNSDKNSWRLNWERW
jgi:hypothetical protein